MSRKSKIDPVLKIKAVEDILILKKGIFEVARELNVDPATVTAWRSIYLNGGPAALSDQLVNKVYSKETKLRAVRDYLDHKGSLFDISQKYGIRSRERLRCWVKAYNAHEEIKCRGSGGGSYMRKARKTTYEERLKVVQDCLANDKNYGAMAKKYGCSYQQVRNWVKRYEAMGAAGLEDRRGKRAGSLPSRTKEEELRDRIAELERKNLDLQMENDLLKKVRELEMKDRYL
jgi:transposase